MARTPVSIVAAVALLPIVPAACGSDDDGGAASTEVSSQALPPVIVDINSLDGTTVDVPVSGAVDITGDDETFADWTATIADPAVATFMPGRDDGSATFNPGLQAAAVGTTEVTLTNTSTDDTVTFTLDVTAE